MGFRIGFRRSHSDNPGEACGSESEWFTLSQLGQARRSLSGLGLRVSFAFEGFRAQGLVLAGLRLWPTGLSDVTALGLKGEC